MSVSRHWIIAIAILGFFCFFCACLSSPSGTQNQSPVRVVDVGVVPQDNGPYDSPVSFGDAKSNLDLVIRQTQNSANDTIHVFLVRGTDLDGSGNARRWDIGISNGSVSELHVYDYTGMTLIPWGNAVLPAEIIDLGHVIVPSALFNQTKVREFMNAPAGVPARWDLDLTNGTYTITKTTNSSTEVLKFDAVTGAPRE